MDTGVFCTYSASVNMFNGSTKLDPGGSRKAEEKNQDR